MLTALSKSEAGRGVRVVHGAALEKRKNKACEANDL